ncbi:L,D-transpeptidase family protein [Streptosporangium sp. CA-135522]|uniref:L,D-transpeptidase family protein n=1 Tax=Streptosporangium sp. CA-135522 TaxID=3240072 RepID=UPI003D900062
MGVERRLGAAALMTAGAVLVSALSSPGVANARTVASAVPVAAAEAGTTAFVSPGKTLRIGAKGATVKVLQTRLKELGYAPGKIDSQYGGATQAAVWAFQKVNGISPTSTVASRTWHALEAPKAPKVLVPGGKPTRVEMNLTTQVMVLYVDGRVKLISHTSSGSGIPYCETANWNGKVQRFCGSARTPTGDYKTTWRRGGWHKSYLGQLYNPIFFNGGIAFHGALSVPLAPASHGCVRLPMNVAGMLPSLLGKDVPVHVRGRFVR